MEQMARTPKQLGNALRNERLQKKMTQSQLGQKIQLRQATISVLEAGNPGAQLETLFSILMALDLELVVRPRGKLTPQLIIDIFSDKEK